jgi:hypothetical protein
MKPEPGPKHRLELKNLNDFLDVVHFFRRKNIQLYLYDIQYKGQTIKYGIQHTISAQPGNRLYDQVAHMTGWNRPFKRSPATRESVELMILGVCENLTDFHKDDVVIEIYDFTDYNFSLPNSYYVVHIEMRNIECHFNNWYKEQYGVFPVGNPKQEKLVAGVPDTHAVLF